MPGLILRTDPKPEIELGGWGGISLAKIPNLFCVTPKTTNFIKRQDLSKLAKLKLAYAIEKNYRIICKLEFGKKFNKCVSGDKTFKAKRLQLPTCTII